MLDGDFERLAEMIRAATPLDHVRLEPAFAALAGRIVAHGEPDIYTEGALEGARAALGDFLDALQQKEGTLPRFTVARRRHNAHEAVWALHDEFRRQWTEGGEQTD